MNKEERLRALVMEWRGRRFDHEANCDCEVCFAEKGCADELEAALANAAPDAPGREAQSLPDGAEERILDIAEDVSQDLCGGSEAATQIIAAKLMEAVYMREARPDLAPDAVLERGDGCAKCGYAHIALDALRVAKGSEGHYDVPYRIGILAEEREGREARPDLAPAMIHGIDCKKEPHVGDGYLHDENDDAPYYVDGWPYCGRCHLALTTVQR